LGFGVVAKRQAAFERNILRRMFGEIKVNENWRKRNNKELLQLFGGLDVLFICQNKSVEWGWSC